MRAFANANRDLRGKQLTVSADWRPPFLVAYKKSGVQCFGRRFQAKLSVDVLEGKIHAGADHAEVVLGSVDNVPAEITDPANVRGEPNFYSTANLTDCPRLAACMTNRLHNVEAFSRFSKCLIDWPLAATKDPAGAAKNIRRKARARNWIAESEST